MSFDYPHPPRRPAAASPWSYLGPLLLLAFAFMAVAWLAGYWSPLRPANDPNAAPRTVAPRGDLASDEQSTIALFKAAAPSVAFITTTVQAQRFDMRVEEIPAGTGSGFVWDADGHIVTNFHVIQNARAARVTLTGEQSYPARLVGASPDDDLAVLKIDAPKAALPPIPVGGSKELSVGQKVFAIGNPFGLDHTLTTGIVSAVGRSIVGVSGRPIDGLIQTDAAINPGNSGGPLLDSAGRLIGVNVAIRREAQGIGFAIPVDTVNQVVPELIRRGSVARPSLGVALADAGQARQVGVRRGLLIINVTAGGAAEAAGLRPTRRTDDGRIALGDVILSVDGTAVNTLADLQRAVGRKKPGDTITLAVQRDGGPVEVAVTLGGQ